MILLYFLVAIDIVEHFLRTAITSDFWFSLRRVKHFTAGQFFSPVQLNQTKICSQLSLFQILFSLYCRLLIFACSFLRVLIIFLVPFLSVTLASSTASIHALTYLFD